MSNARSANTAPVDYRGPPPPRGRYGDRYDDRRAGGYGGGRRDDSYRSSRYGGGGGRYEDRGYSRRYDDRPPIDRYASNERYGGSRGESRNLALA